VTVIFSIVGLALIAGDSQFSAAGCCSQSSSLRAAARRCALFAAIFALLGVSPAWAVLTPGLDISHYQGTINWPQVAADPKGYKFVFMKATEDTNYTDPTFNTNLAGAKSVGIMAGPYHFCRLDTGSADPAADAVGEANYFLSKIKSKYQTGTYLPPVADIETWPTGLTTAALKTLTTTWTNSFSDTIYASLGVRPIVYTSGSKASTLFASPVPTQEPLWVAAWHTTGTASPPSNASVSPWSTWKFWQWSDDTTSYPADGTITGFPAGVRIDRDVFNGTAAQIQTMLLGKDPTAKPGDFNRDGKANAADYSFWKSANGTTVPLFTGADANGDTKVDAKDLAFWTAAVPEPTSAVLFSIAFTFYGLNTYRGRRRN